MTLSHIPRHPYTLAAAALVALACLLTPPSAAAEITEVKFCRQKFSGHGVLVGDLDCRDRKYNRRPAVQITYGGRLDLNGFKIIKGRGRQAVRCLANCKVLNGTLELRRRGKSAVRGRRKVTLDNVVIDGNWTNGVLGRHNVYVLNSTIHNTRSAGVRALNGEAYVLNSDIAGNGEKGLEENGIGIWAEGRVTIIESLVYYNYRFGAVSDTQRVVIENTAMFDNNRRVGRCDIDLTCADMRSARKPTLFQATCERSDRKRLSDPDDPFPGTPWGVCTLD